MIEYDSLGRITKITPGEKIHKGISHCNKCNFFKTMFVCWDTICISCNQTFCHEHSVDINGYWYCQECAEKDLKTLKLE